MGTPGQPGFRADLAMDDDAQSLGNSPGADGRGRLHTKISNKIDEPIPIEIVGIDIPPLEVELDHENDSVSIWGTDGTYDQKIKTNNLGQIEIGNFPTTFEVTQGTDPWNVAGTVSIDNFPTSFEVTQGTDPWNVAGTVDVGNFPSSFEVTQGTDPWNVSVTNFPAIQPVSQSGVWSVGRTWALDFTADSVEVIQGSDPWDIDGTVSATQSGAWTTGRTWTLASGTDSVSSVQSGAWDITNITGTVSLPIGAATETTLSAINGKLPVSLGQKTMAASLAVVVASDQSAIPVSQSGTWTTARSWTLSSGTDSVDAVQSGTWNINNISGTISLPTGAATESTLSAINGKLPANLGQKTMANSFAVAIASDQSAIPVTQSGTWTVQQGTPPWQMVGNVASAATDSGNPVKTAAKYNATLPTFTDGQRSDHQSSQYGELVVTTRGNYSHITGATTVTIKSGAGRLKKIVINRPTNGTYTVYDNTSAAGTVIAIIGPTNGTSPSFLEYDLDFTTGLTITTTGANTDLTVTYL